MPFLLVFALLPSARAVPIERRTFFSLLSMPFVARSPEPSVITSPSPAMLQHRTRNLATMVAPEPMMTHGPVPPAYTLEFEVMRDWHQRHPEHAAQFTKLLADFHAAQDEATRLERAKAPQDEIYAQIDESARVWSALRALMTEEPWASLDWPQVFAEPIAQMERRIAARLGHVDIARVYQLVEHALPERNGQWGTEAFIRDVTKGFDDLTAPLYSAESLNVLLEEAARVSDVLAFTFQYANPGEPDRQSLRRTLAKNAGLPLTNQWYGHEEPFTFALREHGEIRLGEPAKYVPRYRRALAWLERCRVGLDGVGGSALKTSLLEQIAYLQRALREEVATLPARRLATEPVAHGVPAVIRSTFADWRAAMDASSLANWADTLRGFELTALADELVVTEPPACAGALTYVPVVPLAPEPMHDVEREPRREPVSE